MTDTQIIRRYIQSGDVDQGEVMAATARIDKAMREQAQRLNKALTVVAMLNAEVDSLRGKEAAARVSIVCAMKTMADELGIDLSDDDR